MFILFFNICNILTVSHVCSSFTCEIFDLKYIEPTESDYNIPVHDCVVAPLFFVFV